MGELLTIAEAAKRAGLAESTARFYRDRHASFIPVIGEGRGRRYPVEAVDVLRTIAEAAKQGATPEMIDTLLRTRFPIESRPAAAAAAGQQEGTARMRAALADLMREAVRDEVSGLMAEVTTLREEVARLTALLSASQGQQEPQQNATPTEASQPPTPRPWWMFWRRDT